MPSVVVEPAAQGVLQRFGLLVDLLEHEMLEAARVVLLGGRVQVVDGGRHHGHALRLEMLPVVRRQHAHLMVVEVDDFLGEAGQGAGVAGEEAFAVADAEHQRAAQPGADDHARLQPADDGQAVGALEQRQHLRHGPDQTFAVEAAGDQVGDDLGVGVAVEDDALLLKLPFQSGIVLDDAVVDDGDDAVAADVRVGVAVVGGAVRGPARVADAGRAGCRVLFQVGRQAGRCGRPACGRAGAEPVTVATPALS